MPEYKGRALSDPAQALRAFPAAFAALRQGGWVYADDTLTIHAWAYNGLTTEARTEVQTWVARLGLVDPSGQTRRPVDDLIEGLDAADTLAKARAAIKKWAIAHRDRGGF